VGEVTIGHLLSVIFSVSVAFIGLIWRYRADARAVQDRLDKAREDAVEKAKEQTEFRTETKIDLDSLKTWRTDMTLESKKDREAFFGAIKKSADELFEGMKEHDSKVREAVQQSESRTQEQIKEVRGDVKDIGSKIDKLTGKLEGVKV